VRMPPATSPRACASNGQRPFTARYSPKCDSGEFRQTGRRSGAWRCDREDAGPGGSQSPRLKGFGPNGNQRRVPASLYRRLNSEYRLALIRAVST
jgi:hypothetical protein